MRSLPCERWLHTQYRRLGMPSSSTTTNHIPSKTTGSTPKRSGWRYVCNLCWSFVPTDTLCLSATLRTVVALAYLPSDVEPTLHTPALLPNGFVLSLAAHFECQRQRLVCPFCVSEVPSGRFVLRLFVSLWVARRRVCVQTLPQTIVGLLGLLAYSRSQPFHDRRCV